ncbi:MAG: polysaccharide biosynthesis protein [Acidimicrobiia bacterium]
MERSDLKPGERRPNPGAPRRRSKLWLVAARDRSVIQAGWDALSWALAIAVATAARFDFHWTHFDRTGLLVVVPIAIVLQLVVGAGVGLYRVRWRYGSFEEVAALARCVTIVGLLLAAFSTVAGQDVVLLPRSTPVSGSLVALVAMCGVRYVWRLNVDRRLRPAAAERTIVFGAGAAGASIVADLLRNPDSPFLPVALLDDDPRKANLRILGIAVQGGREAMARVKERTNAGTLLVALPSARAELIRELTGLAHECGLTVKVLPPLTELLGNQPDVGHIRPITEADLLGRRVIDTDIAKVANYLTGKRVLVTGAGGSIGSELCRQIHLFAPEALYMLDRDESALHAVQMSIEGRALLDTDALILTDIRDRNLLINIFERVRPDVVFHAAALKHLPLLERYPSEAMKSNVLGTQNVLDAAVAAGVERFVNISTDKAANPISVLGYSKRIAERLTADVANRLQRPFVSVRFGNVLGSRGSVLGAFHRQIDNGGPVTVTDPDVTRYFMTVEEAVQLTIQAAAIGRPGEAMVFDMGEPVRIADVARRLVAQADRPIRIEFTGLRQGEKLHEDLLGDGEPDVRPNHPLISQVPVPAMGVAEIASAVLLEGSAMRSALAVLAQRSAARPTASPAGSPLP